MLATGIADKIPSIPDWTMAIRRGLIRLCPICDAYEVIDQNIAVVSCFAKNGVSHALFLQTYTRTVTLFYFTETALTWREREKLRQAHIDVIEDAHGEIHAVEQEKPAIRLSSGEMLYFDVIYPMLGENPRSELATRLGAKCNKQRELIVGPHCRTTVAGLYAAGDVVSGLNQISVAMGHAAIAATDIHNELNRQAPIGFRQTRNDEIHRLRPAVEKD